MVRIFAVSGQCILGACLALVLSVPLCGARAETVLYSFCSQGGESCTDGAGPYAPLIADKAGNLYGTTGGGGAAEYGTVFELSAGGAETVLHSFAGGSDGNDPMAGLTRDKHGNLYGTTYEGGANGDGTVFEVAAGGGETVLYSFAGGDDGANPSGGVILDKKGNLYGTTQWGGANDEGTVFKLAPDGTETVLHTFAGSDGANPAASLLLKKDYLYGTTSFGGSTGCYNNMGCGAVFKLALKNDTYTMLYAFAGGSDGQRPQAGLIWRKGHFYGTTLDGGATDNGTIFKLAPDGTETILYAFQGYPNDGGGPEGGLIWNKGNFYGTTEGGGSTDYGTVFEVSPGGTESVLYTFRGGYDDGAFPWDSVIAMDGTLYGTTNEGGASLFGTVFSLGQ